MNTEDFETTAKRIKDVNKVIEGLEPEIRVAAFELLKDYIISGKDVGDEADSQVQESTGTGLEAQDADSKSSFFSKFDYEKPSDNALLIAAYHYSLYGTEPITIEDVKEIASDVGLTIPNKVNMTYTNAQRKKKKLFKSAGKGKFRPTVHGEAFFKDEFKVAKGTKTKPKDTNE